MLVDNELISLSINHSGSFEMKMTQNDTDSYYFVQISGPEKSNIQGKSPLSGKIHSEGSYEFVTFELKIKILKVFFSQ